MTRDQYQKQDGHFRPISEHLADCDPVSEEQLSQEISAESLVALSRPPKLPETVPITGQVEGEQSRQIQEEHQGWESVDTIESRGIIMNDQNQQPQQGQQNYPGYQQPQQQAYQNPQQGYQQVQQQPQQQVQQSYEQAMYAPMNQAQQPQRMGPSPVEFFFRDLLAQVKAFFSVDPANTLMVTYQSKQSLLWVFWLPIFLLLSSFSVYGIVVGYARSVTLGLLDLPTSRIYLSAFLTYLVAVLCHVGRCFVLSLAGKQSPGALKVFNLSMATLMPQLIFGLLAGLLGLLYAPIGIIVLVFTFICTEVLTFILAKREFGLAKMATGNWIYIGTFMGFWVLNFLLCSLIAYHQVIGAAVESFS